MICLSVFVCIRHLKCVCVCMCVCVCELGVNIVRVEGGRSQFRAPGSFRPWQRLPTERGSRRFSHRKQRGRRSCCLSDFSFHENQNTSTNVSKNMDICLLFFFLFHGLWGYSFVGQFNLEVRRLYDILSVIWTDHIWLNCPFITTAQRRSTTILYPVHRLTLWAPPRIHSYLFWYLCGPSSYVT